MRIVNGRTYSSTPGTVVDVNDSGSAALQANGLFVCSIVGTTAQRPTLTDSPQPLQPGLDYFDTTLGKTITFDGLTWRAPLNANAV